MKLLSDRIQEFIDWLEAETDVGQWHHSVRTEVHRKLIECIISRELLDFEKSPKSKHFTEDK